LLRLNVIGRASALSDRDWPAYHAGRIFPLSEAFMRVILTTAFVFAAASLVAADDKKNEAELKAAIGKWDIQKAELGGKDITDNLKAMKFEITGAGKYSLVLGEEKDEGTFTVDASKTPKEMDIQSTVGPNKDKIIKAIYTLEGDTMVVCYELGGANKRPTKFESKADSKLFLVNYKRKK
jgi:uncharacterized protein (TIGR03067 family)